MERGPGKGQEQAGTMRNQKLRESKNAELRRKALEKTVKKQVGSRSSDEMQDEKQRPGDTPETCSKQLNVRTRRPSLRSRLTSCLGMSPRRSLGPYEREQRTGYGCGWRESSFWVRGQQTFRKEPDCRYLQLGSSLLKLPSSCKSSHGQYVMWPCANKTL